ncbi:hypothetical protein QOZ80_9AG0675620 [Eleusine coracana subsp. coracana]|nr:hypothetical protein QOZ80_9AG0675620 [Eleusine coracana subsp. coracana]
MDSETSMLKLLQKILLDETADPTDLPLSLLKSITNDFSDDLQIGYGGFAVVYKGFVGNAETLVAVKKLSNKIDMDDAKYNHETFIISCSVLNICVKGVCMSISKVRLVDSTGRKDTK